MERKAFLDQEPPPGYVAGVGRGATGFVTSAESGNSIRNRRPFEALDDEADGEQEDAVGILAGGFDDEADKIYEAVERRLSKRRNQEAAVVEAKQEDNLQLKFADLKKDLTTINNDEWYNIPEATDATKKNKRQKILEQSQQRTYATPDSIISKATEGDISRFNAQETESEDISEEVIVDMQKNRAILSSLRKTEPNKPSTWIASARVELQAKNFPAARKFISEGCKRVPNSEELWLENVNLHNTLKQDPKITKIVVAEGLKYNSLSERLWLKAVDCEHKADILSQEKVLKKALTFIPHSKTIWERLIELQNEEHDVKSILLKVIELCPQEWNFWVTLINMSDYKEARELINRARKAMKQNELVWVTALKVEEKGNVDVKIEKLVKMITKGMQEVFTAGLSFDPNTWYTEAAKAEKEGFLLTCKAIVMATVQKFLEGSIGTDIDAIFNDIQHYTESKAFVTATALCDAFIPELTEDVGAWLRFLAALKRIETFTPLDIFGYYQKAIDAHPSNELLRLMYAKDRMILDKDIPSARKILEDALHDLGSSVEIWLAAVKIEVYAGDMVEAYKRSCDMVENLAASSSRVWYKHIHLSRFMNHKGAIDNYEVTIKDSLNKAKSNFPLDEKILLQESQIYSEDLQDFSSASEALANSTNLLPNSVHLWILYAVIEEQKLKKIIRARSILDKAIVKNPGSELLWLEKIRFERRQNDLVAARQLCNKALIKFKSSPDIWVQHLSLIPKMQHRKPAFIDALKETGDSPLILLSIGVFFWIDGKLLKAKQWFYRAKDKNPANGDIWGWLYNFWKTNGTDAELSSFVQEYLQVADDINEGETWNIVNKSVANYTTSREQIIQSVAKKLKDTTII